MNAGDWVAIVVGIISISAGFAALIRYIAKNALRSELEEIKHELKPNSGSSMKDQMNRMEIDIAKQKENHLDTTTKLEKLEGKVDKMFEVILRHFS